MCSFDDASPTWSGWLFTKWQDEIMASSKLESTNVECGFLMSVYLYRVQRCSEREFKLKVQHSGLILKHPCPTSPHVIFLQTRPLICPFPAASAKSSRFGSTKVRYFEWNSRPWTVFVSATPSATTLNFWNDLWRPWHGLCCHLG